MVSTGVIGRVPSDTVPPAQQRQSTEMGKVPLLLMAASCAPTNRCAKHYGCLHLALADPRQVIVRHNGSAALTIGHPWSVAKTVLVFRLFCEKQKPFRY